MFHINTKWWLNILKPFFFKDSSPITNIFTLREAYDPPLAFFFEVLVCPLYLLESFSYMSLRMRGHCTKMVRKSGVHADNASRCAEKRKQNPRRQFQASFKSYMIWGIRNTWMRTSATTKNT